MARPKSKEQATYKTVRLSQEAQAMWLTIAQEEGKLNNSSMVVEEAIREQFKRKKLNLPDDWKDQVTEWTQSRRDRPTNTELAARKEGEE